MKIVHLVLLMIVYMSISAVAATDYKLDAGFNAGFTSNDDVNDVFVLPGGKMLIAGKVCTSGSATSCTPILRRLNADGSIDATFNAAFSPIAGGGGTVSRIRLLPGGQFFVYGDFNIGSQRTNIARVSADGVIDPAVPPTLIGTLTDIETTPDGKIIVCGERTINGQLHDIAYRLNGDGTPDPSFRITFIQGRCFELEVQPDGKLIVSVQADTGAGEPAIKPLYRVNTDGSQDMSFSTDLETGSRTAGVTLLPDGKSVLRFIAANGTGVTRVKRVSSTGLTEMTTTSCDGQLFFPVADGTILTTECWRYPPSGFSQPYLEFARLYPDGTTDTKLDNIYFDHKLHGIRDAGDGTYLAFGEFSGVNKIFAAPHRKLVRLQPNVDRPRPKFDFDGDGKSDLAVYRPSNNVWYLYQSTAGIAYHLFGAAGDRPAAGHFDADGKVDVGTVRPGTWQQMSSVYGHRWMNLGPEGGVPFTGNFDESLTTFDDFAVRGPFQGGIRWYFKYGAVNFIPGAPRDLELITGETLADKPIVGDFNGDSKTEFGYFRDGTWVTSDPHGHQLPANIQWGLPGDIPVPEDYDGDRETDYAIFRPSTGHWWIERSTEGMIVHHFGANGDIPVPADYDGDGKVDIAIYRGGLWWQYHSATGTVRVDHWGLPDDIPIPAQSQ